MSELPIIPSVAPWSIVHVRDVVSLLRRGTPPNYVEQSDTLAIGQRCVRENGFDPKQARFHRNLRDPRALVPEVGDVLINSTGTGTIGRSVVFSDFTRHYIVDGHVTVARPNPHILESRWLNDTLQSDEGQNYLETHCYSGSTNQLELSRYELAAMSITLPPLPEQRHIAEILDALDDQIRLTQAHAEKIAPCYRGLADRLVADSFNRGDPIVTLGEIIAKDGGLIQTGPFGSQLHAYEYVDDGIPVVMPQDINAGIISTESIAHVSTKTALPLTRHRLCIGDIVIARRGDLGRASVVTSREAGWLCGTGCLLVRTPNTLMAQWLALVYTHELGASHVRAHAVGSTMPNLNSQILSSFSFPLPSLLNQSCATEELASINSVLLWAEAELTKLRTLKAGLMDDLLSGKVRVVDRNVGGG